MFVALILLFVCFCRLPQPGVKLEPPKWECQVLDTGPPEISLASRNINWCELYGGLCLETKTQLHPAACKLQCSMPKSKEPASQDCSPTNHQRGWLTLTKVTEAPKTRPLTEPCPPGKQYWDPPTKAWAKGSLNKALDQTHPPGGRHQKQEEIWPYCLWEEDPKHSEWDQMRWQRNMVQR